MGIEYRISCPPQNLPKLEAFLRGAGGQPCSRFPEQLEFRIRPATPGEMPDATVVIEADGLYFCDYGGPNAAVDVLFRRVIDEALALSDSSDSVTITGL